MPITRHDKPVYNLTCDICGTVAEHEGMICRFDSREGAASYADDFDWRGPSCLNDGEPTLCPDCAAKADEQEARERSDREHHEAEIAAAIQYTTGDLGAGA